MNPVPEHIGSSSTDDNQKKAALTGFRGISGNNSPGDLMKVLLQNVRDYAIFMIDPTGFIVEWTEGAERITGYSTEEAVGRHLSLFYTPEEIASGQPARELTEAATTGRSERVGWRIVKNGDRLLINEIATAIRDDKGVLLGFAKISRDITERKLAEEALQHSEERLKIVMESVRDQASFTTDPQNIITSWNTGAYNLFGYSAGEAIGQSAEIIFTLQDRIAGEEIVRSG
jgi:PAS domain S-box-containing protein